MRYSICILVVALGLLGNQPLLAAESVGNMSAAAILDPALPEEFRGMKWHYFETENFEVMAIDRQQALLVVEKAEALKEWSYRRWGLHNVPYTKKCMILCVPTEELFVKAYRRTEIDPKVSKSKNLDGTDREVFGIWIAAKENFMSNTLPEKIGRVNLLNYEHTYNVKLPTWAHVGMAALDNDVRTVGSMISSLDANSSYSVQPLLKRTFEATNAISDSEYKARCAALCLMLRKIGSSKQFVYFLSKTTTFGMEHALSVYGWNSTEDVDKLYNGYVRNLAFDLKNGKTPIMGLTWIPSRRVGE